MKLYSAIALSPLRARCALPTFFTSLLALAALGSAMAQAHGIVGDRFFPPTMATDDPFATDELLLPSFSYTKGVGGDTGAEFDKEIFPGFALGLSADYLTQKPDGLPSSNGFDDFTLSAKYQTWQNAEHEAIISFGALWQLGGTGSLQVGANSESTITPTIYFGKGMGDLPADLAWLRPFALTGTLGEDLPTRSSPTNGLEWGFALEYSLPYLQSHVRDLGLPAPFKDLIPLVEFNFTTPKDRALGGGTTGTINPGFLYESKYYQLGVEAIVPANSASGHNVGVMVNCQIFIDDLWPNIFGHPLFGN